MHVLGMNSLDPGTPSTECQILSRGTVSRWIRETLALLVQHQCAKAWKLCLQIPGTAQSSKCCRKQTEKQTGAMYTVIHTCKHCKRNANGFKKFYINLEDEVSFVMSKEGLESCYFPTGLQRIFDIRDTCKVQLQSVREIFSKFGQFGGPHREAMCSCRDEGLVKTQTKSYIVKSCLHLWLQHGWSPVWRNEKGPGGAVQDAGGSEWRKWRRRQWRIRRQPFSSDLMSILTFQGSLWLMSYQFTHFEITQTWR